MIGGSIPWPYIVIFAALLGLIIGSFLNVLIIRLPQQLFAAQELTDDSSTATTTKRWFGLDYLITPNSHCRHCQQALRPWHNIPLISWVWLRARCAYCAAPISVRYPLIEAGTAIATVIILTHFGVSLAAGYASVLVWGLIALSAIDKAEQLLPDQLTLPLLWLGLFANLTGIFVPLESAVIGAIAGYLSLWLVFHLFHLLTGKEGLGYGDFKLFAALGAWMGWGMLPQILLLASITGALVGITLILFRGRDRQTPLPFGPFLAGAGCIALLYGDTINHWYLGTMRFI
jgi:leader peptidase (prepilin peptidase)/N-methyltransferase